MKTIYPQNISWFYIDRTMQIINKINKQIISLNDQDLNFWLEIDKNETYSVILLNLYSQIANSKEQIIINFDNFLNRMIYMNVLQVISN